MTRTELAKLGIALATLGEMANPQYEGALMDCTLEMRQLGWAHFAGKGLQSEAEAILAKSSSSSTTIGCGHCDTEKYRKGRFKKLCNNTSAKVMRWGKNSSVSGRKPKCCA